MERLSPRTAVPLPLPSLLLATLLLSLLLFSILPLTSCGNDKGTTPAGDTTAPAVIQDLAVESATLAGVGLRWTAPGDDGSVGTASRYDLRYSPTAITASTWNSATVASPAPVPAAAGATEGYTISGLTVGTWYFACKTADEVPNWSALSNVVSATISADGTAPNAVTDLAVSSLGARSVVLTWSAPGDDGVLGRATTYDLRYARSPVALGNWSGASRAQGAPTPDSAGTAQSFRVSGLDSGITYYFALRTADEVANWSALSNVVEGATTTAPLVRLTTSPSGRIGAVMPAWSPDGRTIAFAADWQTDLSYSIYVVPATGESPAPLTGEPPDNFAPSWSPDGSKIAFISRRTGQDQLWVMDAVPGAMPAQLTFEEQQVLHPTWSPDGTRIAYYVPTSVYPQPYTGAIHVVPSAGGTPTPLVDHPSLNSDPAWSPDGSRIAFVSNRSGSTDIWVFPVNGGSSGQLTRAPGWELYPSWSPDGGRIAFSSDATGNWEIWVMSADGKNPVQLTDSPAFETDPTWSPGGDRIAFVSRSSGNDAPSDIWILYVE